MTKPLPVQIFTCDKVSLISSDHLKNIQVTASSALLQWIAPEGHTRLKAFNIHLHSNDSKVILFYTSSLHVTHSYLFYPSRLSEM